MRIVVTGASGNVGTALLRALSRDGRHDLVGVSRRRPPDAAPYARVQWYEADLSDREAAEPVLAEALRGADVVVNLAWMIQPSHDRELMRRTNVEGTRLVADAARKAKVAHLVHMSSIGTYSPGPGKRIDESWPTGPRACPVRITASTRRPARRC
jgi:UDP-glucose 4-epimerase